MCVQLRGTVCSVSRLVGRSFVRSFVGLFVCLFFRWCWLPPPKSRALSLSQSSCLSLSLSHVVVAMSRTVISAFVLTKQSPLCADSAKFSGHVSGSIGNH